MSKYITDLINDLKLNHEYCSKQTILAAASTISQQAKEIETANRKIIDLMATFELRRTVAENAIVDNSMLDMHKVTIDVLESNFSGDCAEYVNELLYKLNMARIFLESECNHPQGSTDCRFCRILKGTELTHTKSKLNGRLKGETMTSTCWLIEKIIDGSAHWWMRENNHYGEWDTPDRWTTNASNARKYETKFDAEYVIGNDMLGCTATNHMFYD